MSGLSDGDAPCNSHIDYHHPFRGTILKRTEFGEQLLLDILLSTETLVAFFLCYLNQDTFEQRDSDNELFLIHYHCRKRVK